MNLKKVFLIVILVAILLFGGIAIFKGGKKDEQNYVPNLPNWLFLF